MKQYKVFIYISIFTLCSVVLAGVLFHNTRENALAEIQDITIGQPYTTDNISYFTSAQQASTSGTVSGWIKLSSAYQVTSDFVSFQSDLIQVYFTQSGSYRTFTYTFHNGTTSTTGGNRVTFSIRKENENYVTCVLYNSNQSPTSSIVLNTRTATYLDNAYTITFNSTTISNNSITGTGAGTVPNNIWADIKHFLKTAPLSYNVTWNITNGTGSPASITQGQTNTLSITPFQGYNYPRNITYNGNAYDVQYFDDTGEIIITKPSSDFTITAVCENLVTLQSGYYIINKYSYDNSNSFNIPIDFRLMTFELAELNGQLQNPLPISESVQLYHYIANDTGLYQGLNAYITLSDDPVKLYSYGNDTYSDRFIHIATPQQIAAQYADTLIFVGENYDILGYVGYPIAIDYYNAGLNTNIISDTTTGILDALFSGLFGSIFAVEIFPGFPLYIFILIPVVFAILSLVLWLMRGK